MTLSWLQNYNLLIFDKIDSTNSEALRLAKTNITGNFVIVAREQKSGRGRQGRFWESLSGNLHATILIESSNNLNRIKELSFLTAIALHKTIISYIQVLKSSSLDVKLKWPNDVLVNDKKIAGILIESTRYNNKNYVIIGVGVNTHFIPKIQNTLTTSLFNEGIILKHSDDFLNEFIKKFQVYYEKWKVENSFVNIQKQWLKNAYHLNKQIILDNGVQKISGIFRGINSDGAISIESIDGLIQNFASGDLKFL